MTTTTSGSEMVLKADARGRIKTPKARRQSLLEEFDRSGLSGAKFAALAGIKYSTFASWLHERRHGGGQVKEPIDATRQMRWLETVIEQAHGPANAQSTLVLELPGGARAQIGSVNQATLAAALLGALAKPAPAC